MLTANFALIFWHWN